jgi:hypothetical protein
MKLKLELFGSKCNDYPSLSVLHNKLTVYSGNVVENFTVEIDLDPADSNLITLVGINKSDGKNGKWDTVVDADGNILQDKYLLVNDICLDDISMGREWIKKLHFESSDHNDNTVFTGWWQNGTVSFKIELPLFDWIIQQKFILAESAESLNSSDRSGESRFGYRYIQNKINIIKHILND